MASMEQRRKRLSACAVLFAMGGFLLSLPSGAQSDGEEGVVLIDGLMWTRATNGESVPWNDAAEHCETLDLDGHGDWRLPTLAELEALHDPDAAERGGIRSPFELEDCCVWSSVNLVEIEAEAKGVLPDPTNDPADYFWGFLFPSGIRYYSFRRFPDGQAMCVRGASHQ